MLWLTDIHAEIRDLTKIDALVTKIKKNPHPYICISGDIGENKLSYQILNLLSKQTDKIIFFVLGNHDYYGFSISEFQKMTDSIYRSHPKIHYLSALQPIEIKKNIGIIGIDNFYDFTGIEDIDPKSITSKDFFKISDFSDLQFSEIRNFLTCYSSICADFLEKKLNAGFAKFDKLILVCHVPITMKEELLKNEYGNKKWEPILSNPHLGQFLEKYMGQRPDKKLRVLSGHTHHKAHVSLLENLNISVGKANKEEIYLEQVLL